MLFREKQQIMILVLAAAIVGGFVLLRYLPLRNIMEAVKQQRAKQDLDIAKAQVDKNQLPMLQNQLQRLQEVVTNFQVKIPVERDLGSFLRKIADLMNELALKEQVITPGSEIQTDKLNCIPINIQCKGKLSQIFGFYKNLQTLGRLVRIERVELLNDRDFNGDVTMDTKAVIYYRAKLTQG